MQFPHLLRSLTFVSVLGLTQATTPISHIIEGRKTISDANTPQCPDYCAGTIINESLIHDYVCGDTRLGPKRLPTKLPLDALTETYNPFGGLCPGQFLAKWFNTTSGYYNYPPDSGYQLDVNGNPIEGNITFQVGFLIDRFGSEYGNFVSPAAAPYMQRALPPSNLDSPPGDPAYPYNYHIYKIVKPFNALTGPIAAWFGQPGQGVQYQLSTNVLGLISGGFLERVDLSAL